jgi:hypothetical protein
MIKMECLSRATVHHKKTPHPDTNLLSAPIRHQCFEAGHLEPARDGTGFKLQKTNYTYFTATVKESQQVSEYLRFHVEILAHSPMHITNNCAFCALIKRITQKYTDKINPQASASIQRERRKFLCKNYAID